MSDQSLKIMQNVLNGVQNVKIPSEIKLEKTQRIEFADTTRKWLLLFFSCSLLVVVLSLGFAWWSYQFEYKPKKELEVLDKQHEWLINYVGEMAEKNPKTHNQYLEENPIPQ
ncbi:MAG: hypothetical protein JW870_17640 [Candidatus Delongbacteria bacterium]|nr:hypothetical protein [Candidatus Delongbacteria bacterium]